MTDRVCEAEGCDKPAVKQERVSHRTVWLCQMHRQYVHNGIVPPLEDADASSNNAADLGERVLTAYLAAGHPPGHRECLAVERTVPLVLAALAADAIPNSAADIQGTCPTCGADAIASRGEWHATRNREADLLERIACIVRDELGVKTDQPPLPVDYAIARKVLDALR